MTLPLFDTHAHLISDDWDTYRPQALRPDLPTPKKPDYTVTVDALIEMMDANGVTDACLVQRGHLYGYDNSYILDSARKHPDRLHPVVILDPQDPETPARYRAMVENDNVRGFRMAHLRPWILDTAWMSSPQAMEVWKTCADLGTPMTLILFMKQLPYLLPLIRIIAKQFPDLPILLDHGGMPFGMTQYEVGLAREAGEPVELPGPPHFGIDTTIAQLAERALQDHRDQHGAVRGRRRARGARRAAHGRRVRPASSRVGLGRRPEHAVDLRAEGADGPRRGRFPHRGGGPGLPARHRRARRPRRAVSRW
jgi:predicted TIM-barrel fold metal-dependent hydrolase